MIDVYIRKCATRGVKSEFENRIYTITTTGHGHIDNPYNLKNKNYQPNKDTFK